MKVYGIYFTQIVREILANIFFSFPFVRKIRAIGGRTTSINEVEKILNQFDFFMSELIDVNGKTIVEIGPGDSLGLAPLFISRGAKKYIAIDRFPGSVFSERSSQFYRLIEEKFEPLPLSWRSKVEVIPRSIEDATLLECADCIVSFNALEHLYDLNSACIAMRLLLKPKAFMVHRIDYGPHDVWTKSPDFFSFRDVPKWSWSLMGSHRGYPNRLNHQQVIDIFRNSGFKVVDLVTNLHNGQPIDAIIRCSID